MGLGKRFSDAVASGRAAVRALEEGEPFAPGPQPGLGALVVGLAAAEIAELAPSLLAAARREGARAVLLTDAADIAVFQLPEIATEYLAPLPGLAAAAPGRDAELYLRRRVELIRRKWNLMRVLYFGETAAANLVRAWGGASQELSPELFVSGMLPGGLKARPSERPAEGMR